MVLDTIHLIALAIILGLIVTLILSSSNLKKKIRELEEKLAEEKKKRSFPLLEFDVDKNELEAYLFNNSYCYAKEITILDLNIVVRMGFDKKLILKFDPINLLKPNQKVKLHFRVFDREYDITTGSSKSLLLQLTNQDFEMNLAFQNMEGQRFESSIIYDKENFILKEIKPLDEVEQ